MDTEQSEFVRAAERGASAVEYGLLIVAIAAVIVIAVVGLGGITSGSVDDTCTRFANERGTTC
jgi:pilus assembly protein Flp/PilA